MIYSALKVDEESQLKQSRCNIDIHTADSKDITDALHTLMHQISIYCQKISKMTYIIFQDIIVNNIVGYKCLISVIKTLLYNFK